MESALDRFARTRGAALLGLASMGRQWKIQAAVGGGLLGLAGVLGLLSAGLHEPGIMAGAIGPSIAGLINLSFGLGFRRQAKRLDGAVALSEPATALLRALVTRAQVWQGGWRPRNAPLHGPHAWPGYRAPVQPSAGVMAVLEETAAAHGRVMDALGEAKDERATRLLAAADAGMGEALHLAATRGEDTTEIGAVAERLDEMATLVVRAVERPEVASPLRSNLEATLEELRAEDAARQELNGR